MCTREPSESDGVPMDDRQRRAPARAQPPDDSTPARREEASLAGGRTAALGATLRYAVAQTGWVRGARVLARTHQDPGFDCPGCPRPEPRPRAAIVCFD